MIRLLGVATAMVILHLVAVVPAGAQLSSSSREMAQLRLQYREATAHLSANRRRSFEKLLPGLTDYPLYPYLIYDDYRARAARLKHDQIQAFAEEYADTPLPTLLRNEWWRALYGARRYKDYVRYFDPEAASPVQLCRFGNALLRTGRASAAYSLAPELWTVPRSQPPECDPLFAAWLKSKTFSPKFAWERFAAALESGEVSLASYVLRHVDDQRRPLATRMLTLYSTPAMLGRVHHYKTDDEAARRVIAFGLARLARSDGPRARALWELFQKSHSFPADAVEDIERRIIEGEIYGGTLSDLTLIPDLASSPAADRTGVKLARHLVAHRRWQELGSVLRSLSIERQDEPRWQYWRARAEHELLGDDSNAETRLRQLAGDRSYFGFLAAHRLGVPPTLAPRLDNVDPALVQRLEHHPRLVRALELYFLGENTRARREWRELMAALPDSESKLAAGEVAARWGWHRMSVQSVIATRAWDVLDLRFPLGFAEEVLPRAAGAGLDPSWVFATVRQESAFEPTARSPVGARGLMQLMPATARHTAKRHGLRLNTSAELYEPSRNIRIATTYLASLSKRYDGHRALASAAYNAGPHRVTRWRKAVPTSPIDIWVEAIPFDETRNYVQNVLAYSYIYGRLLEIEHPFLYPAEE